jgi:hypothetical protein
MVVDDPDASKDLELSLDDIAAALSCDVRHSQRHVLDESIAGVTLVSGRPQAIDADDSDCVEVEKVVAPAKQLLAIQEDGKSSDCGQVFAEGDKF